MPGEYPVLVNGEQIGSLRVTGSGAMTLFDAEAEFDGGILRLSVYGNGREGFLGVMSPVGSGKTVGLKKKLSRAAMKDFPENIEYAGPSGALPAPRAPKPEPETSAEPEPCPDGDTLWYASPDGTLSSFDGNRLLVALPATDPRVPAWAGDVVRVINGRKYVVFPW